MVLWTDRDRVSWAQALDPELRRPLGASVKLGRLSTASGLAAEKPLAIALPDGDLALFGALANGRITYTRGSEAAARRLAPKTLIAPSELELLGMTATATSSGFALFLLRAAFEPDASGPQGASAELYWFDPKGEPRGAPLRWQIKSAYSPRMSVCRSDHYLAWRTTDGVVITTVFASRERSPESLFPHGPEVMTHLGPLLCADDGAQLVASWEQSYGGSGESENYKIKPALYIAEVNAHGAGGSWRALRLKRPPVLQGFDDAHPWESDLSLAVHDGEAGLQLMVGSQRAAKLASLDSLEDKRFSRELSVPGDATCVPVGDGARAVCARRRAGKPNNPCDTPWELSVSFHGATPKADREPSATEYWATTPIADAEAPSARARALQDSRLDCGAPGWQGLESAMAAWCNEAGGRPDRSGDKAGAMLCAREQAASLLSQVKSCSNLPAACGKTHAVVPSVDRKEFEEGKRVELGYFAEAEYCAVFFARGAQGWRVADHECHGD